MLSTHHIFRSLHTTCPRLARRRNRANPGAAFQLKAFEAEEELAQDPEGFGNLESDFMDVSRTHRHHEREKEEQREQVRRYMVKHKYFPDVQLPNMLTYAEKEQIRLLHGRNPEEWTIERLAESFPATPQVLEKILEAKWRPRSTKRIREHDEAVIRNWEQLREGKNDVQLPPELKEHLQRFATRKREDLQTPAEDWPTRTALPQPQQQEFVSLITSCSKYAEQEKSVPQLKAGARTAISSPPNPSEAEDETYLLSKVYDKRKMRLQELKQFKLRPSELAISRTTLETAPSSTLEQQAAEAFGNPSGTGILPAHLQPKTANLQSSSATQSSDLNYAQKYESNEIVISVEDQKRFEMTRIKDRVYIPRKLRRKGATYRVEDCYYDDDGEFLYRVPGMTG